MNMEAALGVVGLIFALFLVISAAVETVLEAARGILGQWVPGLRGAVSLDAAIRQAREFAPPGGELESKLAALKSAVGNAPKTLANVRTAVESQIQKVDGLIATAKSSGVAPDALTVTEALNEVATRVSGAISEYERRRILVLRVTSALIGFGLCAVAGVNVLHLVGQVPGLAMELAATPNWLGELVTGIAASSGSSYWHDKVDKVRSLKNLSQQAAGLMGS